MKEHVQMKPMLAESISEAQLSELQFPVGVTYKVDGIRTLKIDGKMKTRSLKLIRNQVLSKWLEDVLPEGADGEIVAGGTFQETTSYVMTSMLHKEGNPIQPPPFVKFYFFDWIQNNNSKEPYQKRMERLTQYTSPSDNIIKLEPRIVNNPNELLKFEAEAIEKGFEGVIIRTLDSPYKFGRSTLKQQWMLKLKRFVDDEAEVIDVEELKHNENQSFTNELGYKARSHANAGRTASGMLGSLHVAHKQGVFNIGTGFSENERVALWNNRDKLKGKLVKFKYFPVGVKDLPRHPVFLGFRDVDDM